MTLAEVKTYDREYLTVTQVAPILQTDPQTIRLQARFRPELLGFPVIILKSRVKIPRRPFINFMERGDPAFSSEAT